MYEENYVFSKEEELASVGKNPIVQLNDKLTKDEELDLGRKIQAMREIKERIEDGQAQLSKEEIDTLDKGEKAFTKLVGNYYNLARKIAYQHLKRTGTKYEIEDLMQDAISALCEAAYDYDPAKNCKLSTYAFYGITKRVSSGINYHRLVRMPENKMGEYIEIMRAQREYNMLTKQEQDEFGNELEYVYQNVGKITRPEVDLILENMQPQVSLNAIIHDGGAELLDIIVDDRPDANTPEEVDLDENVVKIIDKLNSYEHDLIAFEFGVYPPSMPYKDFLIKYGKTDDDIKPEIRKTIRKMRRIAKLDIKKQ